MKKVTIIIPNYNGLKFMGPVPGTSSFAVTFNCWWWTTVPPTAAWGLAEGAWASFHFLRPTLAFPER